MSVPATSTAATASVEALLQLARPCVRDLQAYQSARSQVLEADIFLDANESPWSPLPGDTACDGLNRYPAPQPQQLLARLGALYGVAKEQLLVGRGVDEGIDLLLRAFCEAGQDEIIICPPTYGMYAIAAQLQGARVREVPLETPGFSIDVAGIAQAIGPATKLVFVCSPNNPTGQVVPVAQIEHLGAALGGRALLVVDEAYVEFCPSKTAIQTCQQFPNIIVLRTLSKAWALAGARLGSVIAHPKLIALLQKVRAPYPLAAPSVQLVMRALAPRGTQLFHTRVQRLVDARNRLAKDLMQSPEIIEVFPSDSNFLLVRVVDAAELVARCRVQGMVLRDRSSEHGLSNCVRITVGSEPENALLLDALRVPQPTETHDHARDASDG